MVTQKTRDILHNALSSISDRMESAYTAAAWTPLGRKFRARSAVDYEVKSVADYVRLIKSRTPLPQSTEILFHAKSKRIGIDKINDLEDPSEIERSYINGFDPYLAKLENVQIFGKSSLIFGKLNIAVSDMLADPNVGHFIDMRDDQVVLKQKGNTLSVFPPRPSRTINNAFFLSGLFATHFGHWFAEFLPRLRHLEQLEGFEDVPILVDSSMGPSLVEMLNYFCGNEIITIKDRECVHVRELLTAPTITPFAPNYFPGVSTPFEQQAAWSAEAMRYMRDKILVHFANNIPQTRAIYISRRNSHWGIVSNEADVEDCLKELGFEIVQPEHHSFAQQVAIIRSSHTVVAATGSALNSLMLANLNTRMLLLAQAENHNWGGWVGPMRDLGFDPKFLLMKSGSLTEKHLPITVNIDRLRHFATEIMGRRGTT